MGFVASKLCDKKENYSEIISKKGDKFYSTYTGPQAAAKSTPLQREIAQSSILERRKHEKDDTFEKKVTG